MVKLNKPWMMLDWYYGWFKQTDSDNVYIRLYKS